MSSSSTSPRTTRSTQVLGGSRRYSPYAWSSGYSRHRRLSPETDTQVLAPAPYVQSYCHAPVVPNLVHQHRPLPSAGVDVLPSTPYDDSIMDTTPFVKSTAALVRDANAGRVGISVPSMPSSFDNFWDPPGAPLDALANDQVGMSTETHRLGMPPAMAGLHGRGFREAYARLSTPSSVLCSFPGEMTRGIRAAEQDDCKRRLAATSRTSLTLVS
jgi:hypothetical protein